MAILGNTKVTNLTLLDGVVGNLNPVETGVYDLGTSSLKWRTLYGNAETATALKDKSNNTLTYLNYGASGMSTTSWLGSWDGYTLKAITPANAVKAALGTTAIGAAGTPIYWNGSNFVAGNAAATANHTHSYLANTNTGAADRPIYITGNAPTQTTYRMSATNAAATTARAITDNLETGNWYVSGTNSTDLYSQSDGVAYVEKYSDSWIHEIYGDYRTGQIAVRGKNNGTWQAWRKILDSSNYSTWAASASHTHGNLTNDGKITSTATIANGDKLVIVDSDTTAASKITGSSITFDGSTTTKALTPKGTWETFNNYSHPTGAGNNHIPSGGSSGQYLKYSSSGVAVWAAAPVTSVASKTGAVTLGTLTIGGKTYNGSSDTTIEIADLGLASTTTFIGLTSTNLSNGSTTNPVTITVGPTTGSVTATNGNVVMEADSGEEYIWAGNKWNLMGLASSWALANHIHGNITNAGTITADTAVANSQHLVITDSNNKVSRSSLTLDTSKTGEYLTHAGTWATPPNNAVTITNTTTDATYDVLFSSSTTTTTNKTEGARKTTNFTFNPSSKTLTVNGGTVVATTFSGNATSATKATKDGDNNTISSTYLKLSGGTMTGTLTIKGLKATSGTDYGTTLPTSGSAGQVFFQLSDPTYELPVGGTTGQFLTKSSNSDRVVQWTNTMSIPLNFITGSSIVLTKTGVTKGVAPSTDQWGPGIYFQDSAGGTTHANGFGYIGNIYNTAGDTDTRIYTYRPTPNQTIEAYLYMRCLANGQFRAGVTNAPFYGAVWNDYAEYRKDNTNEKEQQQPGRCVKENGNGTLSLTTKRLERGCEIISDTFGFAIGQDEENGYNTPIASSGRVLAYPYEDIEEFKTHIGYCVCSGPKGTVSIMTEEEEEKYPGRIIGTISEIPDYEEWGTGKVKVNGRIWIRIK